MIHSIETLLVDVPTIRPHKLSMATMNTQTLVLVRMRFSDGIESWGEATTIGGLSYGPCLMWLTRVIGSLSTVLRLSGR